MMAVVLARARGTGSRLRREWARTAGGPRADKLTARPVEEGRMTTTQTRKETGPWWVVGLNECGLANECGIRQPTERADEGERRNEDKERGGEGREGRSTYIIPRRARQHELPQQRQAPWRRRGRTGYSQARRVRDGKESRADASSFTMGANPRPRHPSASDQFKGTLPADSPGQLASSVTLTTTAP